MVAGAGAPRAGAGQQAQGEQPEGRAGPAQQGEDGGPGEHAGIGLATPSSTHKEIGGIGGWGVDRISYIPTHLSYVCTYFNVPQYFPLFLTTIGWNSPTDLFAKTAGCILFSSPGIQEPYVRFFFCHR